MKLRIDGVSKTYPNGTQALKDVSLTVPAGLYGLLGPNGAGKSTLMRTIATLQEPDEGAISLHLNDDDDNRKKVDVLNDKPGVRRLLGYLPQEFGLYPKAKAGDLLDHMATLKGITDKSERQSVVEALLKQTNLADVRDQQLGGFSGGMKRRFGIAVALLSDPRLIIVDEPTAGLDPAERTRFLNLLSELGEESVVILSTHIVKDVRELCSKMAIIREGEIVFEGHPGTAMDAVDGALWKKTVAKDELAAYEDAHRVINTKLVAGRPVIHVHAPDRPGADFEAVDPTLEDVYFTKMKDGAAPASSNGVAPGDPYEDASPAATKPPAAGVES